jgi:3-oxoacyl-[acyl-carrier protein] reductase
MDDNLNGRVALVTGSSRGLGKEIAKVLALNGVDVIINGRHSSDNDKVVSEIESACNPNIEVYALNCDVMDPESINNAFTHKMSEVNGLDILVNNVGNIETFGKFEDLNDEDWLKSFQLTFMSAVRFIRLSLPYLKMSDQARIINIASLSAHQPSFTGLNPHYGMAKAGLINLTKNLASDFGKYGILVNSICPSTLAGGGWDSNIKDRAKRDGITPEQAETTMRQEESHKSPLNNMGELSDVANLVIFLSSDKAGFLTGHCYNVDGGITRAV